MFFATALLSLCSSEFVNFVLKDSVYYVCLSIEFSLFTSTISTCQGKKPWCGYYHPFSCWCNWRSLLCDSLRYHIYDFVFFIFNLFIRTFSFSNKILLCSFEIHLNIILCSGLDDLRDWTNNVQRNIPIYVANRDFEVQTLPYFSSTPLYF